MSRRWGLVFVVKVVFEMLDVGEVVCRSLVQRDEGKQATGEC